MATGIECLKWNTSTFQPSNVLDHTEYTLALKPSHWLNLKSKGLSIKLSYLGLTQRLASLDNLNNLYVYDWSKANLKTLKSKYEHNSKLTSLTSNTLGNKIVTCSDNGKIQIWNYKFSSWKMLTEFRGHYQCFVASNMFHRNWVNTAKFFKEDKLIISCSRDCYVQVFDCCSGKCVAKFNLSPDFAESLSLKEEFSIAVGTNQGSIQIFDLRALKVLQKYNEHTSQVNCVKFQYKTPCLVSVSKDKKLNVYDTNEGRFLYSIDHLSEIRSMDISFDDKLLATTSFHFDNEITLWKTETL
ncbi:PREDICTED: POC1 centriolar protein homolog B-like isoform X2 [Diuraphis noxia]|uniref:POC1 centriolar protein homolog B-like isoform X2 n=1 Tax=Diuraphis noxia TaxID=143948 RepID=UPI00076390A2|nr:PREDICTED: POC1 centriolar protein homolog B-like isoform X2 [Diuraphis noxia]